MKLCSVKLVKVVTVMACILILSIVSLSSNENVFIDDEYEHWNAKEVAQDQPFSSMVEDQVIHLDSSKITYPKLIAGGTKEQLSQWNQLVYQDVEKIMAVYGLKDNESKEQEPKSTNDFLDIVVTVKYKITLFQSRYLSILYQADSYFPEGPYPVTMIYTTNLDLLTNQRMVMGDILKGGVSLTKDFSNWTLITSGIEGEDIRKGISDYFAGLGMAPLIRGIQKADIIGSENTLGIYSYLTPTKMGIVVALPHYLGDFALLEQNYEELTEYLLIDMP